MLRSALSSRSLALLAAGFLAAQTAACTPSASNDGSGGSGSGSGGSGSGSGGKVGSGGSGGSGSGSGGKVGTGGSGTATGGSGTGTGGSGTATGGSGTATGGSGTATGGSGTATGGSGTATGGSGTATGGSGTATGGSGTATGGSGTATGGSGAGTGGVGVGGAGANRACAAASADVLSDFEENSGVMINQGSRTGFWYVYFPMSDTLTAPASGQMQTPMKPGTPGPIAVATTPDVPTGDTAMCDKYALHSTGSGFGGTMNNYAGFGSSFSPMSPPPSPSQLKNKYDLSAYTGIKFNIKSGGTAPAVFFEMLTSDNQPTTAGGTAADTATNLYNSRGRMLNDPWTPGGIGTSWKTVYVPFGTLVPRWLPAPGSSSHACTVAGAASDPICQAPNFNPKNVLAFQFSVLQDPGFPKPSGATAGSYDLWVDDVELVKGDMGLATMAGFPDDGMVGSCVKPTTANGKYLVQAYSMWKSNFVQGSVGGPRKVVRPENGNDAVSEGIAYGMLISLYMNDQSLFDDLWKYWKTMLATTDSGGVGLMTWNNTGGSGSATDADEDAAFALMEASKKWAGGTYAADAMNMIHAVLSHDMSGSYIKGGSNYAAGDATNPSYFAPGYYTEFAKFDTGNAAAWTALAGGAYSLLGAVGGTSTNGLYAAWCSGGSCSGISNNKGSSEGSDKIFQYDSHRIPFRFGLDYCWHGTGAAKTYLSGKIIKYLSGKATGGIARLSDAYDPASGNAASAGTVMAGTNSASMIGCAAVGAMADSQFQSFLDEGYQFVLDLVNRSTLANYNDGTKSAYSYYNATVGMLTLLAMTGNFRPL